MQIHLTPGPVPHPMPRNIYLPIVTAPAPVSVPPDAVQQFYDLLLNDPRQERPTLARSSTLTLAANWRAAGLAAGDPWGHADASGVTPNQYARRSGCRLPADYAQKGNNIESLAAGTGEATIIFDALANSPRHGDHLFGRGDFFRRQTCAGIAVATGGVWGWYWVVMIAICEQVSGE